MCKKIKKIAKQFKMFCFPKKYWGTKASGIMYICKDDGTILLLKRADNVDAPGTWGISGGAIDGGFVRHNHKKPDPSDEIFLESAERETLEELSILPKTEFLVDITVFRDQDFTYKTFIYNINKNEKANWTPQIGLNWENNNAKWFLIDKLPNNLHKGVAFSIRLLLKNN